MGQIRKLQSAFGKVAANTSVTCTFAPNGPGTVILLTAGVADPTGVLDISDTGAHDWIPLSSNTSSIDTVSAYFAITKTSAPITITVTSGLAGNQFMNILLDEFSGVDVYDPINNSTATWGAVGSPTVSLTPSKDFCMLWAACNDNITAVGGGFTKGADDASSDWTEWKALGVGTSGVAQTANFTGTAPWNLAAVLLNATPNARLGRTRPAPFAPGLAR